MKHRALASRTTALVAALTAATAAHATAPAAATPAFERAVELDGPGRVAVRLDRDVYEAARADLGDLRVLDRARGLVPFVLDRGESAARIGERRPALLNRGRTAAGEATVDLDFGGPGVSRSRLELRLSGDNFRRAVSVSGSAEGRDWTTLVDEAWVFAVPGADAARYETVDLPVNDFAILRVRVRPGPDERERVSIEDAWVPADERRPVRGGDARAEAHARRSARERDVADARPRSGAPAFPRGRARRGRPAVLPRGDRRGASRRARARRAAGRVGWAEIGRGAIYRLGSATRPSECLRVSVAGRERALRVRLRNRDDRPLAVRAARVRVPVERVVFEAAGERAYRLVYGSTEAPPEFDLARTVGDVEAWAAGAREARLGPPHRLAAAAGEEAAWTERHPALLWTGLLAVVAALGALVWRAMPRGTSR